MTILTLSSLRLQMVWQQPGLLHYPTSLEGIGEKEQDFKWRLLPTSKESSPLRPRGPLPSSDFCARKTLGSSSGLRSSWLCSRVMTTHHVINWVVLGGQDKVYVCTEHTLRLTRENLDGGGGSDGVFLGGAATSVASEGSSETYQGKVTWKDLLTSGPQPGPRLAFCSSRSWPSCWQPLSTQGPQRRASSSSLHVG